MDVVIVIGILSAFAAGALCYAAHAYAKHHRWGYIPRYGYGVGVAALAFAPVVFAATDRPMAILLCGMLALIFLGEGVATALAHQNDPDPPPTELTPDANRLLQAIDEELRK